MMPQAKRAAAAAIDNPHAPVTFKAAAGGRVVAMLGAWTVGEIMPDAQARDLVIYSVRLPDIPIMWRRPVLLAEAQNRIAAAVREWVDGSEIAEWLRSQEATRAVGYGRTK